MHVNWGEMGKSSSDSKRDGDVVLPVDWSYRQKMLCKYNNISTAFAVMVVPVPSSLDLRLVVCAYAIHQQPGTKKYTVKFIRSR